MSFISKLKSFFIRNKSASSRKQTDIINIRDLLQIPGRDFFTNNLEYLELIDSYKSECLEILSQRRTLVSTDISSKELIEKKDMCISLILNMIMREDYYDYENQSILDNKIILLKLKIYLDEISKVENETIARIIALVELDKSKKVPHRNRNVLRAEIDSLKLSLFALITQKMSISNEIDNYLMHISISDDKLYPSVIEARRDKTLKYASYILGSEPLFSTSELEDTNINKQMAIIAILETKIEEKLYTDKPNIDITSLTWQADSIGCTPDLNYRETKSIKDVLLKDLSKIEDRFMAYHLFGKRIVKQEHLNRLYDAKFKILTFDVFEHYDDYDLDSLLFNRGNRIEKSAYEDIVYQKKVKILSGENSLIKLIKLELGEASALRVVKLLSTYFKEDRSRFTFYGDKDWHHSNEALSLILALDSKASFIRFLNRKIKIKSLPFEAPFYELKLNVGEERQFTFDDIVPLKTLIEVIPNDNLSYYYRCLKELFSDCKRICGAKDLMPEGFKVAYKNSLAEGSYYILPEGIKEILSYSHPYGSYAEKVIEESKGLNIIMPSTLKEIYGSLFNSSDISGVILNDGIEKIKRFANIKPIRNAFDVPSSVTDCDTGSFVDKVDTIRFLDYENSKLLKKPRALGSLLYDILTCETLKFKNCRTKVDLSYVERRIDVDVKVKAIPEKVRYIILESDGKDVFKIDLCSISCYGTLKDMHSKQKSYKVNWELATRYAKVLLNRINVLTKEEKKELSLTLRKH